MTLSDLKVRAARPRDKDYKLADSGGLYLLVTPSGGKLWRFKFRLHGIEKKLALGRYPDVSLSEARKARDTARASVVAGSDPALTKRRQRIAAKIAVAPRQAPMRRAPQPPPGCPGDRARAPP